MDFKKVNWSALRTSGTSGTITCSSLSVAKVGPDQSIPYSDASSYNNNGRTCTIGITTSMTLAINGVKFLWFL